MNESETQTNEIQIQNMRVVTWKNVRIPNRIRLQKVAWTWNGERMQKNRIQNGRNATI